MVVPALPALARDLGATADAAQLTVTLYLMGIGTGQLIAGPAADRRGRRPVMLAGLGAYVLGSLGATLAADAVTLLAARLVQALGGAAGLVAARAIVADLTERPEAAARLAALMTVLLVSPAVAPVIGGAIASLAGWRFIFALLAALGALGALMSHRMIGETWSAGRAGPPRRLLEDYGRLLRNSRFLRYAFANACGSCALYFFLAASSFLLVRTFGLRPDQAGICYFLIAAASIGGTLAVRLLERRGGALRVGLGLVVAGAVLMFVLHSAGVHGVVALIGPMLVVGYGGGIAAPAGLAGAMHAEEGLAGTSASLAGALQMLIAGLVTSLVAQAGIASVGAIAAGILLSGLAGLLAAPRGRAVARV